IPEYDPWKESFYKDANWNEVRSGVREIFIYASPDDPIVPYSQSKYISKAVKANAFISVKNAGHFNTKSGYNSFPMLYEHLTQYIGNRVANRPSFENRLFNFVRQFG